MAQDGGWLPWLNPPAMVDVRAAVYEDFAHDDSLHEYEDFAADMGANSMGLQQFADQDLGDSQVKCSHTETYYFTR